MSGIHSQRQGRFNEKIVAEIYRGKGFDVLDLNERGFPDLLILKDGKIQMFIEVKGGGKKEVQMKHNGFYTLLGQIISRMDIEGNGIKKARIYAIAIPAEWENTFKNKIVKMKYGWKILKLKIFLVTSAGSVKERSYAYFLKRK